MLAEIFMVRLEAAARVPGQTTTVSSSPFVPIPRDVQVRFKNQKESAANDTADRGGEPVGGDCLRKPGL